VTIHASALIHPSALVEEGAEIGPFCEVGPFCVVESEVKLGEGVRLSSHAVIAGDTWIGAGGEVHPFAVIGGTPQDLKYAGERTRLRIGVRARIREHVTVNLGTAGGGGETSIGDDVLLMAGCHVAHDCRVGDRVIVVNNSALAGHCEVGDDVIVGGLSGVHQWVRIGEGAIIGALSMVTKDVLPYGLVQAPRAELDGLNLVGLKRRGAPRADVQALRAALRSLRTGEGTFQERAERVGAGTDSDYVRRMVAFVTGESERSFLVPR
jgi:UDP-N-acetylglucosamine acyltransferase